MDINNETLENALNVML